MRKRHNTLTDNIFRNSKYIKSLEQKLNLKNFRTTFKEQYNIMLNVFKTLILINNILFADSNKNIYDKKIEILDLLTIILYGSLDSNNVETTKYQYSTRTIKKLIDRYTRHLFIKYIEWYEYLNYLNKLTLIKNEVEKEMNYLESIDFDNIKKSGFSYKKNKINHYRIYVSKFDYLYYNQKEEIKKYRNTFYDLYGIHVKRKDIYFIHKLIAYANNGIVKLIYKYKIKRFNLTLKSLASDFFTAYLENLDIKIEDKYNFGLGSKIFIKEFKNTTNIIKNNIKDKNILNISNLSLDEFTANYDLYFFYINMRNMIHINSYQSDLLNKIMKDLKEIFILLYNNILLVTDEKALHRAFMKIQKVIKRNQNIFERLS